MCLGKTGLKAFLLAINVIFFLCGASVLGIGIWAVAEKLYISDIVGSSMFNSASYMMVVCGCFLILLSFFGCFVTVSAKKLLVTVFLVTQIVIFIILMSTAILAAVFQDDIESNLKYKMEQTIRENFGFYVEVNEDNQQATESWDLLQSKLQCCGVENEGWYIYKLSRWFLQQYSEYDKKFVPLSCCKYVGKLNQYLNPAQCQSSWSGPPNNIGFGMPHNDALNYPGCYDQLRKYVEDQSTLILGVGFSFCVFLLTGIVLTIMFIRKLSSGGMAHIDREY